MARKRLPAWLALEDGSVYEGLSFGTAGETSGEVVFNTSMAGYQEVLTDPSYKGQMVVMTVAHVGNCGINPDDVESTRPYVEGFIVREACAVPSNWRSQESFPDYLARHGIVGIEDVDTRALVTRLRMKGALRGVISTSERRRQTLVERAKAVPPIEERDLVTEVSCAKPFSWQDPVKPLLTDSDPQRQNPEQMEFEGSGGPFHVVVVDCGVKYNILRSLVSAGCRLTVIPAFSTAPDILGYKPDGVVFSNGPGDPERLPQICQTARELFGNVPVFGICLGHQVIGRALGANTFKLKFGHHGGNHPVMHRPSGTVEITAQNHNFAVDAATLPSGVEVTHLNLNDQTVEGQRHKELPLFSIQYHPEASPGPHDARKHFKSFVKMIQAAKYGTSVPHPSIMD